MFGDQQAKQDGQAQSPNPKASTIGIGVNPSGYAGTGSTPAATPQATVVAPAATATPAPSPTPAASNPADDDLNALKRQALEELSPLINQLDQTAEEKYKTLMMMIQASDNRDLIGSAYQAAQKISDEKTKAEALLNIVNEINYFTQKS